MKKADVQEYRTSGEYKPKSSGWRQMNKVMPHEAWRSTKEAPHNRGLLIARRKKAHWPVSVSAIETFLKAETDGVIDKGYLLLVDNKLVVNIYTMKEAKDATKYDLPNEGTNGWGDYYFFNEKLEVVPPGNFDEGDQDL